MNFLPWNRIIAEKAEREKGIIEIMTVAPMQYQYRVHPNFAQFAEFVYEAELIGYTIKRLYHMFCAGAVEPDIDALIKKHAQGWPPTGTIVDADRGK